MIVFLMCCEGVLSSSHAGVTPLSEGISIQAITVLNEVGNVQDGNGLGDFDSQHLIAIVLNENYTYPMALTMIRANQERGHSERNVFY